MLEIKEYISDAELLYTHGLYGSTLWQCRLLIDVVLHLFIKNLSPTKEETESNWKKFNEEERLDKKLERSFEVVMKKLDKEASSDILEELINDSRDLERGRLEEDLWQERSGRALVSIKKLINYCNSFL
jgi:hypothetical protein